jgi:hypothetical protein
MAFKEVTDLNADTTISLGGVNRKTNKANPKSVEGYYLGKRTVEDKKKKSGVSYIYILQTPKGNLGVWGKTDMDRKMLQTVPGAMIRITHTGMVNTPSGEMYKYSVEQDTENCIEVSANAEPSKSADEDDLDAALGEGTGEDEDNEPNEAPTRQPLAASSAERKAKVQALLKKK